MTVDLKQQARKWRQEHWNEFDVAHPTSMLAAFGEHVLSQQSATPQGISEEGRGLGDAAKSGPGSARVPSDYRPADAASLIPIAPALKAKKDEWNGRCECGHLHSQHAPIVSHNWSAGQCKSCDCRGFVHDQKD